MVAVSPLDVLAPVGLVALFGLNKSPIFDSGLVGEAEAVGVAEALVVGSLRRVPRAVAEEEGEGDSAVSARDAALSDFLGVRCLAGVREADGDVVGEGD